MRSSRSVTIRLCDATIGAIFRAARAEGIGPADFIRAAIADSLGAPEREEVARIRDLRRAVLADLGEAADWIELHRRLRARRLMLRRCHDGSLWLQTWPVERPLFPLARLGADEEDLVLRYRSPFPAATAAPPAGAFPTPRRRSVA